MATSAGHLSKSHCLIFTSSLVFFCLFNSCLAFRHKHLNLSTRALHWSSAGATWYGSPDGAGSDDKMYKTSVVFPETSAGGDNGLLPRRAVPLRFSTLRPGTAFGAMAIPGQEDRLRDAGVLQIRFARVACDYSEKTIAFHVDLGSNPNYFATVIEFEEGDGDLGRVIYNKHRVRNLGDLLFVERESVMSEIGHQEQGLQVTLPADLVFAGPKGIETMVQLQIW
ncbi:UNVERIFIED_CONTAM: Expansin-B15 [Sesamum calycinum]|uniref:Expansin-B15 n=1 Tax=Sesamum calycinum TaxID=2727403 RepID=A0AAW2IUH2_9LAMI